MAAPKILVKLGGALVDDAALLAQVCTQIAALAKGEYGAVRVAVVHGGGKQMTRFLAERGVESTFVGGLRVTSPDVIDAVVKVFAGSVNKTLVGALRAAGVNAVGISGIDGGLAIAEQMDPALGAVGRVVRADATVVDALSNAGFVPVVACVAGGAQGEIYNVNADQLAVACAAAWSVDQLLFLTDVPGVKGADGAVIEKLSSAGAAELCATGVAAGGMKAKLDAACDALRRGVGQVRIAPGAGADVIGQVMRGERVGTTLSL